MTVEAIARQKLDAGRRELHIVAPPGSGKTVMGLYLWSQVVKLPTLVLSPNSAIQSQWVSQCELFRSPDQEVSDLVGMDAQQPQLLTSLTYQAICQVSRSNQSLDDRARVCWAETILESDQANSLASAHQWIIDLENSNPNYFLQRLTHYRKRIRDEDSRMGDAMSTLHPNSLAILHRLRNAGVGMIILDECHHLLGYWGRVIWEACELLGNPIVLGLTATPPDYEGRDRNDIQRYDQILGGVDFEVPVPAVVKDGYLAPYQDLAYFVFPSEEEIEFIAGVESRLAKLVDSLCDLPQDIRERTSLIQWLFDFFQDSTRIHRDPKLVEAAAWFLNTRNVALPSVAKANLLNESASLNRPQSLVTVIDRYTRHYLRRSQNAEDHRLAIEVTQRMRLAGTQIRENSSRPCASPVSRVIAYTRNKSAGLIPILHREMESLKRDTRAVVIADFERSSVTTPEISHLQDKEAGGAVAAIRSILADPRCNELDPVLLTGSTVLVDTDLVTSFLAEARFWLKQKSIRVELKTHPEGLFTMVRGVGADWCPKIYVAMITDLFQRGITKCLVGTRGLLGEGWDANSVNVLIDLSTASTAMSVNQLRGRSLRLDPIRPNKLANNWDIVCIAPHFNQGLDDYRRFRRKHDSIFGICDDGAIEKGVGHVHASFTSLEPELLENSIDAINTDMLRRAAQREAAFERWDVGAPFASRPTRAVEVRAFEGGGFPPFEKSPQAWTTLTLARAIADCIMSALEEMGRLRKHSLKITPRDGGYARVCLENATEENAAMFALAMAEAMGPIRAARYVIPREVDRLRPMRWFGWLPQGLKKFIQARDRHPMMLHAVPSVLGANRRLANCYQKYWNQWVSPGEVVFAKNENGQRVIEQAAKDDLLPNSIVHDKEIFI